MKKHILLVVISANLFYGFVRAQETFTDTRDGRTYKCITIGGQTWMAENLAYLPRIDKMEDGQFEQERYWVYGYYGTDVAAARQTEAYKTYGVLYNWLGACKSCPEGWHLPTDAEWQQLETYLGMSPEDAKARLWRESGNVGKKMMAKEGWKKSLGTGESGFNALPGGIRGYNGFESLLYGAYYWTASPTNGDNGMRRNLLFDDSGVNRTEDRRYIGCSVRCIKNK